MKKTTFLILFSLMLVACQRPVNDQENIEDIPPKISQTEPIPQEIDDWPPEKDEPYIILNQDGTTIETRYNPPKGFSRIDIDEDSFGQFLRGQELKAYGEKALYYDGRPKSPEGIYDSVIDVDIGDRDLHQCADAIMLLRAEYLYKYERYDEIQFNFVNGFLANYDNWMSGYRIQVNDNETKWVDQAEPSTDYESFRKYMDMVFAYAGTLSLDKELDLVDISDMKIGDVFIQGGSPGHAVIVVDMAENKENDQIAFLLAQSYMPAQETQILINRDDNEISPWYIMDSSRSLVTPEWEFQINDLKRFP